MTSFAELAALAATLATEPRGVEYTRTPTSTTWTIHTATCADFTALSGRLPADPERRWLNGARTPYGRSGPSEITTHHYHAAGGGCVVHVCLGCGR